jgi:hypothetical protein
MKQCCTPFQSSKLFWILQDLTTFNAKVNKCLAPSIAMQRLKCFSHLQNTRTPPCNYINKCKKHSDGCWVQTNESKECNLHSPEDLAFNGNVRNNLAPSITTFVLNHRSTKYIIPTLHLSNECKKHSAPTRLSRSNWGMSCAFSKSCSNNLTTQS